MAKEKPITAAGTLRLVPQAEASKVQLIDEKLGDQLRELIRSINSAAIAEAKRKAKRACTPHTEHDPELPPAA